MSRPRSLQPAYCRHKSSNRAFVTLDGRRVYLGTHGTQESRDAYAKAIGEWIVRGRRILEPSPTSPPSAASVTITVMIHAFREHAKTYYVNGDGTPSGEFENYRLALRPLRRLYGSLLAASFGPLHLKTLRTEMLRPTLTDPASARQRQRPGWSRTYTNRQIGRIKHVFKWALENELIPPAVYQGIAAVSGLRRGRSEARETEPVLPVPQAHIDSVLPLVGSHVRAMIQLQLLTGSRAGELCSLRSCDLETSGAVWIYRPSSHKTAHHGHVREIRIGPKAQAILRPFLRPDLTSYVFSPADAERERRARQRDLRKSPVQPSQLKRAEQSATRQRKRMPKDRYDVPSYRRAIRRACRRADRIAHEQNPNIPATQIIVPPWHPHQLRHNAATELRRRYGIEAARVILGHRSAAVTQIYAEFDHEKAAKIMEDVG